jgi:uncharacterized protein YjbI with pentapeptide repeats
MLLGPTVLITLRVYLQIYVEHGNRLGRLARLVPIVRAPNLIPLQNALIRPLSGVIFYMLLPVAMMLFAWKAAVFPVWGSVLLGVAVAVILSHLLLRFPKFSWRLKGLVTVSAAAVIAGTVILGFGPPHRSFSLSRSNLSGQRLIGEDFHKADLSMADLTNAELINAKLTDANLTAATLRGAQLASADLSGADLRFADLRDAHLEEANGTKASLSNANMANVHWLSGKLRGADLNNAILRGADLSYADLIGATLIGATLSGAQLGNADLGGADLRGTALNDVNLILAKNLTSAQMDGACGNANTKLPEGLTLRPCSPDR